MKSFLSRLTESIGDNIANTIQNNELITEASEKEINAALKTITVAELMEILKANSKSLYGLVREAIGKSLDSKSVTDDIKKAAQKIEKKPEVKKIRSISFVSSGCGNNSGSIYSGCGSSSRRSYSRSYSSGCGSSSSGGC